jgi:hypothetical protein
MKKFAYSFLMIAALAAFIYVEPAHAQSDRPLAVTVPFNFYVKDRALPAGQYTIALVQVAGADALKIQSADGHLTIFTPSHAAQVRSDQGKAQLIFNKYEDRYFLAQVTGLEEAMTQQVTRSRGEAEIVRNLSAANHQKIAVAARRR